MSTLKSVLLHVSKRGVRPSRTYQSPGIPSLVAVDNVPFDLDPKIVAAQYARIRLDTPRERVDWRAIKDLPEGGRLADSPICSRSKPSDSGN